MYWFLILAVKTLVRKVRTDVEEKRKRSSLKFWHTFIELYRYRSVLVFCIVHVTEFRSFKTSQVFRRKCFLNKFLSRSKS